MQLISIGKNSSNKIVINNPHISNYHAEILIGDDGSVFITDKGSLNGTTVRGQKIQPETEVSVNRGDKVMFAGVVDMDWSKIPIIMPPPPGWKLFSIGNGLKNRIHVNDPTGRVSRYHATLKVDPKGKIFLTDHSSNGTFVNDMRITSGQEIRIKRKDRISFANAASLNWSLIKLPPIIPWKLISAAVVAVLVVAGIVGYYKIHSNDPNNSFVSVFSPSWSLEKTYNTYSNSIVCVYHQYRFVGKLRNSDRELVLFIDEEGKVYKANKGSELAAYFIHGGDGTAFLVDKTGTLVTNRHVTIPWERNIAFYESKRTDFDPNIEKIYGETVFIGITYEKNNISRISDFEECSVLSRTTDDIEKDIGLLRVKNPKQLPQHFTPIDLNKAFLDRNKIPVGEIVYLIGYPLGRNMFSFISTGTTNTVEVKLTSQAGAVNQFPDPIKFGHNALSFGGSSGSPIFNKKGQLIGVHNAGLSQAGISGYAWGILAKHAKDLYDKE